MRCGGEYEGRHYAPLYILMQRQLQVPNGSFLFAFLRHSCVLLASLKFVTGNFQLFSPDHIE